jgi:hypothetical protein
MDGHALTIITIKKAAKKLYKWAFGKHVELAATPKRKRGRPRKEVAMDTPSTTPKGLLGIDFAADYLDCTPNAIRLAVSRGREDLFPKPLLIRHRYYWTQAMLDDWITARIAEQTVAPATPKRGRGRPRKG